MTIWKDTQCHTHSYPILPYPILSYPILMGCYDFWKSHEIVSKSNQNVSQSFQGNVSNFHLKSFWSWVLQCVIALDIEPNEKQRSKALTAAPTSFYRNETKNKDQKTAFKCI